MITIHQVINEALKKKTGEIFEIKDLFNGFDWKKEKSKHRQHLGRDFADYVRNRGSKDFKLIRRKTDNHKVYERL